MTWSQHGTHLIRDLGMGATIELEPSGRGVEAWHRRPGRNPLRIGSFQSEARARQEMDDLAVELAKLYRIVGAE